MSNALSVVLPCFNEEGNIARAVTEVHTWLTQARSGEGEIIVVDDGSRDGSPAILRTLQQTMPMLRIVDLPTNQGYGLAVRAGCDAASGDLIAFMDSDGQFDIHDLSRLLAHIDTYPFVTGRRRKRADSPLRNLFGKVLGLFIFIFLGIWVRDVNCGMKLFRRAIWPHIRPTRSVEKLFNAEIFLRLKRNGIPWFQVDVPHYPRLSGTPTGAKPSVILRMFAEMWALKTIKD